MLREYPLKGWLGLAMLVVAVGIIQFYFVVRHVIHTVLPVQPQTAGFAAQVIALGLLVCGCVLMAKAYRQVVRQRAGGAAARQAD